MKETTLQRMKRLNAEGKSGGIEANETWWEEACKNIIFRCEESAFCPPSELTDFELGMMLGTYASGWTFNKRKEEKK